MKMSFYMPIKNKILEHFYELSPLNYKNYQKVLEFKMMLDKDFDLDHKGIKKKEVILR